MNIGAKQIASKKRVGTLRGKPVTELVTHGGLYLVICEKNDNLEILGSGPHRAVARYIAEKREPDIVYSELSKSDHLDIQSIMSVYDRYVAYTDYMNSLISRE